LIFERKRPGCSVQSQMGVPVNYKGVQLDVGCRLDLLVEDEVIIEIKSAETLQDVHKINW